jgi:iron complex outermembrane recepter protein
LFRFLQQGKKLKIIAHKSCGFDLVASYMIDEVAIRLYSLVFGSWQIVGGKRFRGAHGCRALGCCLAFVIYSSMCSATNQLDTQLYDIDIPKLNAADAINRLAEQSGAILLFPYDITRSRQANPVHGRYTVLDALNRLLQDSGLSAGLSEKGVIKIALDDEVKNDVNEGRSMHSNKSKLNNVAAKTSFFAALLSIFTPVAINAQGADAGVKRTLEEVVVTAQKRAQNVNDIPISIKAYTGDQLRMLGVSSAEDMAQFTPGLTVNDTAATGVPLYTIRGVGFQDYSTAASSTVGLYFDDLAIPYTVMSRGVVFDVERVEVLKGPQGDLYGRNTTAGQINFVSNKPTEEFEAGFSADYGRFDLLEVEGFVSGGLSENMQGRVAFKTSQSLSDGWQKSATRDDTLGEKDATAVRGMLNVDFNEDVSLLLNVHYIQDKSDNKAQTAYNGNIAGLGEFSNPYTPLDQYIIPTGANFGQTPPWYSTGDNRTADWTNSYTSPQTGTTFDLRPQRDNELIGITGRLEWQIGDMTLTSITGYDDFERVEANDWDGGFFNDSSNINTTDLWVFSQELRLAGGNEELNWIAGLYYSKDEMDEYYHYFMSDSVFGLGSIPFGVGLFAPTPIVELDTKYSQETESVAIFGHVEWSFTDDWRLTLGARYTEEDRKWSGCTFVADDGSLAGFLNASFGATLGPGDCGTIDDDPTSPTYIFALIGGPNINDAFHVYNDKISTNKWMGKIGLDYMLNDDVMLFVSGSHGFKSGGFNGANSNTTLQLQPYKAEELTAVEIGTKATLLDGRMQFNASAFWYDYQNKQEQDAAVAFVGNISGLTNVPESTIMGAEVEVEWLVTEGLNVNLGVAYLDTEVDKWDAVDRAASAWPTVVTFDASGIELAQSPEWQYHLMGRYEWPISSTLMMDIGADLNYKDKTTGGSQTTDATDDYMIFNARIGVSTMDGKWRASFWGRNLADEYYYPSAFTGGNGPFVRSVGMPRTYGISIDYRF